MNEMDKNYRKENKQTETKNTHLKVSAVNPPEDQSTARLFESSSNLGTAGDRVLIETDDARLQKQNLAVIRNILEMFNLEDTKKKYEAQNVVDFVLDPNDFGYDCSLSTTRVRQRLCDLMGTDVIRLNDKRYFQTLTQRLQDEYETVMDKQEEARAASEKERLRRLMLEGIIEAPNDYRAVVQGRDKKQSKKKKRRKTKSHTEHHVTYDVDTKASDDEGQSKTRKEDVVTQVEIMSGSRPTSAKSPGSVDDPSLKTSGSRRKSEKKVNVLEKENDRSGQTLKEMHARPPHHESALRPSSSCSTHRKSRRVKSAAPRLTHIGGEPSSSDDENDGATNDFDTQSLPERNSVRKQSKYSAHEPERVTRLRTEETVAGLYSIAEELVSPVGANDQPARKVVTKAKPKKMVFSVTQH